MKLVDTNRYYLPGTGALHLASVQEGVHEYICFYLAGKIYIEEITGGHLEYIEDDSLAQGLTDFLTFQGVLSSNKPLLPDQSWLVKK